jgi:para-nitrobenzyl esterase
MHSKFYLSLVFIAALLVSGIDSAQAQCTGRYLDTLTFSSIDSFQSIVYTTTAGGGADTEVMDIYQPHGDSACLRHLIIFAHGGAFVSGTKNDGDVEIFCHHFASRGYVCAAINYRLAGNILDLYDSNQVFLYSYEACADLKAAIRYFYKDASITNQWNVDTNSIFIGGSSAGAIAADFAATLDSVGQVAAAFQSIVTGNGGIEGNSGNAGYSSKVIGVASLAGAVNAAAWLKPGDPPMVLCQGTADGTIPYYYGLALTQYLGGYYHTIDFCGSGCMAPALDSLGVNYSLLPFPGSGHVPWDTNVAIAQRMDSAVAAFFYTVKCTQTAGICSSPVPPVDTTTGLVSLSDDMHLSVYPNPASDLVEISLSGQNELLSMLLYDYTGREVSSQNVSGKQAAVSVKGLAPGMYVLCIYLSNNSSIPIPRKIIVE